MRRDSLKNVSALQFYEAEALRGSWLLRQIDRHVNSQFCKRTALSKKKAAILTRGQQGSPNDRVVLEEEPKKPFVLKFLDFKDEYSQSELEDTSVRRLENVILELKGSFHFMGTRRCLRIGYERLCVYLLFIQQRLRDLEVIDFRIGKFVHAGLGRCT